MSKRRQKSRSTIAQVHFILTLLLLGALGWSFVQDISPRQLVPGVFTADTTETDTIPYTKEELLAQLKASDQKIDSLDRALGLLKGDQNYRKGLVNIEGTTLNMRSMPSLASSIVLKIPDSSAVDIMYFDTKRYVIDGVYGQWCKIRYADQEGWVWGNYVAILDDASVE